MLMQSFRPAIAMIELIFALVIMGIVMMSAPMLISTSTSNTFVALQQEGINEAASRVNMIMGYNWDENNTDQNYISPILEVTDGHADLDIIAATARRIGTPNQSSRTFIRSALSAGLFDASPLLGVDLGDGGTQDDIDDFGATTLVIVVPATVDYIEQNISIATNVAYMDDTFSGAGAGAYTANNINFTPFNAVLAPGVNPSTNIKSIAVTLTSTSGVTDLAKTITFSAFSCNIGAYTLEERIF